VSDPNNKWNQPAAPPPPMFFGKKERDLVKQVNDELAERVIGQPIAYYAISIEESNFNDTYGEAIDKVSLPPVRVYAYVVVESEQTNERYGHEYETSLTVNFNSKRLTADQNLYVRVGDFVQYGDLFYEIVRTYNDTRYYFGQVEHQFQISAECIRARQGNFRVMPSPDRPPKGAVVEEETGTTPAPRTAPYPPLTATYITVTPNAKLPNERTLTAGSGITLTDGGANSTLTIAAVHRRTAVTTNYTASAADYILAITTTPLSVELDSAQFAPGQVLLVKDESGTAAGGSEVILSASGAQRIDGARAVEMSSPYAALSIYTDGSDWFIY